MRAALLSSTILNSAGVDLRIGIWRWLRFNG